MVVKLPKSSSSNKVPLKQSVRTYEFFSFPSCKFVQNIMRTGLSFPDLVFSPVGQISVLVSKSKAFLQFAVKITSPCRTTTDLPPVLISMHRFSHLYGGRTLAQLPVMHSYSPSKLRHAVRSLQTEAASVVVRLQERTEVRFRHRAPATSPVTFVGPLVQLKIPFRFSHSPLIHLWVQERKYNKMTWT